MATKRKTPTAARAKRTPKPQALSCGCLEMLVRDNDLEALNVLEGETLIFRAAGEREDISRYTVMTLFNDGTYMIGRGPYPSKETRYHFVAIKHTWLTADGNRVEYDLLSEVTV